MALLVWLAWRSGGYFASDHLKAGGIALATVAVLLAVARPRHPFSDRALVALAALAALAAWTGVSRAWTENPATALEDFDRALVYVGLFALGLLAAGSGRLTRTLVWFLFAAITAVGIGALISRLHPDLISTPLTGLRPEPYRLSHPLGYWNALGAYTAMGVVLAVGLAADRSAPVFLRPLAAAAVVPLGSAMYLSLSRGAWGALAAGGVVVVLLAPHRRAFLLSAGIAVAAMALSIGVLADRPALVDDPTLAPGQEAAGDEAWPLLVFIALAAAAAQAVAAASRLPRAMKPVAGRMRGRLLRLVPYVAAALAVVAVGAYIAESDRIESRVAAAVVDVSDYVDRQWEDFLTTSGPAGEGRDRLSSTRGTRSDLYRVAIDGFEASPLTGDGAGSFEYRWIREREVTEKVRDVHSLYLETLSELGLVGAALLLLFLGALVAAALRSRLKPVALSRSQAAGVTAACAVWLVHSAVDWDWQMPALTGMALVLAATLFPAGRSRRRSAQDGAAGPDLPADVARPVDRPHDHEEQAARLVP